MPSANSNRWEVMTDGKSLMNIKKSKGPSMLPCGTPEIIGRALDR